VVAEEITALELARTVEAGEPIQVVDVRAAFRLESGRIDLVPDSSFHNIVGSQLAKVEDLEETGIDPETPIAVVCGKGSDSRVLAAHLNRLGCRARSLAGGMGSWMMLSLERELPPTPSLDRLVQFDRIGKGSLGYLLVSDGEAIVIDPPRDCSPYVTAAESSGSRIIGVADTHVHADYISGAPELAKELQVPYYLHPDDAFYPYDGRPGTIVFQPIEHGQEIAFGRAKLKVAHIPGHTDGSVSYLVEDQAAFTGDFIFIESVGRPDLAGKEEEWTLKLWESLELARSEWQPHLAIYPAHYGSDDERQADRTIGAPLSALLQRNGALQIADRAAFIEWVLCRKASFPDAYRKIKAVNVGLLPVTGDEADELEVGKNECALGGS
jgi:glyoxylase-like metal-dependent hydrolase (beta-lactamase superfamily II)